MKQGQREVIGGHHITYLGRVTFDEAGQPFLTTVPAGGRKLYLVGEGVLTEQEVLVLVLHGGV